MRKALICDIVLILLIISEVFLVLSFTILNTTQEQRAAGQPLNAALHFGVSFLFGFVLVFKYYGNRELTMRPPLTSKGKYIVFLLMAIAFFTLNNISINIFKAFDYRSFTDIIPALEILTRRLLSGQNPYDHHAMEPLLYKGPSNYLSMHWLPYCTAEYFHFDYRTVTFAIWCAGAGFVMFRSLKSGNVWVPVITLMLLCGTYAAIAFQSTYVIGATIETMVVGYYLLFIAGINTKNHILTGLFIATCMLSRYFIIIWLPLWFFVLLVSGYRRALLVTSLSVFFFLLVLYVIPFLSKDWTVPLESLKSYDTLPFHEWLNISCEKCLPGHLYNGSGFAYLFYEHHKADLMQGYLLMKKLFYFIILAPVCLCGIWYWFKRNKIHPNIFLMASFKIYLSCFLSFALIPYLYLMITGFFVSIAIFALQAAYRPAQRPLLTFNG